MINFKKGTAMSLQQSDKVGLAKAGEAVIAGMICQINSSGQVIKGVTAQGVDNVLGFAINNQTDGDVIQSGKIGLLMLDGNTVVETDQTSNGSQVAQPITAANFPVGNRLGADTTTGLVKTWASGDRVIGYVEGIRTLQSVKAVTQSYIALDGTTVSNTANIQTTIPLLGIKLAT